MIGKNSPAFALSCWTTGGVFEILAEIGAAIAGKSVGQRMRIGSDICFRKGPQFGPGRRRQHGDAGITGEEPVQALDGVPMLFAPVAGATDPRSAHGAACAPWSRPSDLIRHTEFAPQKLGRNPRLSRPIR